MSLRKFRLESALEKVLRFMNLRRPQRESLEKVHALILKLDRDLPELTRLEIVERVRELYPKWSFASGFPEMTFALATGVGKTRLMGAIMAYLFIARQSKHFLMLASRAAILRKLEDECRPGSTKYIFVDRSLVADPALWHRGNLESFNPEPATVQLVERGPEIVVVSPQSLTGDDKRAARPSEFSGTSLIEYLRSLDDLVVLMDEAHHLGKVAERETKAWTQAIRELRPRLEFGMTATPRDEKGVNVLHAYDLSACLQEKLYTKDVRLIVRQRTAADFTSDDDWDHHTLDFALDRLRRKEQAIQSYTGDHPFPRIRPVLLVCAENTAHADQIAEWLQTHRGLSNGEILVTHSEKTKTDEDLERLVGIEQPGNRVRVVVNVYELTEGWDVTNVYVISPLRRLGTFQGAVQTMGRGLRLPAGRRVGDDELDSLDVLCFGRESLQEVLRDALQEYGDEEDKESFVSVDNADDDAFKQPEATKTIPIGVAQMIRLDVARAARQPVEPDLDFDLSTMRKIAEKTAVEFDLTQRAVSGTTEGLKYDFDVFVRIVASRVIVGLRYLSDPLHRGAIERLTASFLEGLGQKRDLPVALDWVQVAEVLKEEIDRPYRKKDTTFEILPESDAVVFGPYEWRVPESFTTPKPIRHIAEWDSSMQRLPIGGWRCCAYDAAAFDTSPEYRVARILDDAADVDWWVRNDPPRLRIATPIGFYEPDFVVARRVGGDLVLTIIEVKRGDLWRPPDSDPRVKATAANAWCDAVNRAGVGPRWGHWVVLDSDVASANSVADLEKLRINDNDAARA